MKSLRPCLRAAMIGATCLVPIAAAAQSQLVIPSPLTTPGAGPITSAIIRASGAAKVDTVNGSLTTPTLTGPVTAGTGAAIPGVDVTQAIITPSGASAETLQAALASVALSAAGAVHPLLGTPYIGCGNLNVDGTTVSCNSQTGQLTAIGSGSVTAAAIKTALGATPALLDSNNTESANTSASTWTSEVPQTFAAQGHYEINISKFKCTQVNFVCSSIDPDDTLSFQRALNNDGVQNLGWRVHVPAGSYTISSTLTATLSGNNGVHFVGDGVGETMLVFDQPSTATNFDGFDVTLGSGYLNAMWRVGGQNGQFAYFSGMTIMQHSGLNHPAGDAFHLVGNYRGNAGSVLPMVKIDDVFFVGDNGLNAWLTPIHLLGIQSATISNIEANPGQAGCSTTSPLSGIQTLYGLGTYGSSSGANCYVASAVVLLESGAAYGNQSQGVSVTNANTKGYMASMATNGVTQGDGFSGSAFGNAYDVMLGGSGVLEENTGPSVLTVGTGVSGGNVLTIPITNQTYSPSSAIPANAFSVTLPSVAGIYKGETIADSTTPSNLPANELVTSIHGNTVYFSQNMGSLSVPTTDSLVFSNSSIIANIKIGMSVVANYIGANVTVTGINGNQITVSGSPFGGTFATPEPITFTKGTILTSPIGTGGFNLSGACDVYKSCIEANADTSFSGFGGISTSGGLGIIADDADGDAIGIQTTQGYGNTFSNIVVSNAGPYYVPIQINTSYNGNEGVIANDQFNTNANMPPIQLTSPSVGQVDIHGNQQTTGTVLGLDPYNQGTWGCNVVLGKQVCGLPGNPNAYVVDSSGNMTMSGSVTGLGGVQGPSVGPTGNAAHTAKDYVLGAFSSGSFALPALGVSGAVLPVPPNGSITTIFGTATCEKPGFTYTWGFLGHWMMGSTGTLTVGGFVPNSTYPNGTGNPDPDTTYAMANNTGTSAVTLTAGMTGSSPAIMVNIGSAGGSYDCTAKATMVVAN